MIQRTRTWAISLICLVSAKFQVIPWSMIPRGSTIRICKLPITRLVFWETLVKDHMAKIGNAARCAPWFAITGPTSLNCLSTNRQITMAALTVIGRAHRRVSSTNTHVTLTICLLRAKLIQLTMKRGLVPISLQSLARLTNVATPSLTNQTYASMASTSRLASATKMFQLTTQLMKANFSRKQK